MSVYMKKGPFYYAIVIHGYKDKNECWYLSNKDEIDNFAKKFNMGWTWNTKKGVLDFVDKSDGIKLNRPQNVKIGQVVIAYDYWGTWQVNLWDKDAFEKQFIKVMKQNGECNGR